MKDNYHLMTNRHNATLDQEPYNAALQDLLPISSGFFLDTLGNVSASIKNPTSPSIVFVSRGWTSYYITTCMASMIYVDVNITCATTSRLSQATCAATSIRETSNPPTSTNYTAFSTVPNAYWIARSWPTIFGPQHSMTSTQTELFIADPSSAFVGAAATIKTVELGAVPINVFEKRFGLVFNTFWKASVAPSLIVGGDVSKANLELQPFINTTAAWSQFTPQVYALNTPWLALFFLSTLIMFIAAVFAIFFKMRSRSPDILGYVSTLTRDNPYMGLPAGGSALSGSERARILRDQKVMLVDVRDGEEVGRIAFAAVNDGGRKKELKTGRLYE
jgi:hypothetical protein